MYGIFGIFMVCKISGITIPPYRKYPSYRNNPKNPNNLKNPKLVAMSFRFRALDQYFLEVAR